MTRSFLWVALVFLLASPWPGRADPKNPNTDWFKDAQFGAFMHFLPADTNGLAQVEQFDPEALASQLSRIGARYFIFTLGQNSGYFNSPNHAYDTVTGYAPGQRCSMRDLPLAIYQSLHARGIKLMLYLPCQPPNQDRQAQAAFGLPQGPQDQPLTIEFARKWALIIQEWADRYKDKVAGWWFDGGYASIQFDEAIAQLYAQAVKHGNPGAILTFNPGVQVIHYTDAEDYTAGELNDPLGAQPAARWLGGSQWHALTFVGSSWAQRNSRFSTDQWSQWVSSVAAHGGVVTLDLGPNYDAAAAPIGALSEEQVRAVSGIRPALDALPAAESPVRLKRAQSFLGIHFDFHAGLDCTNIGQYTTRAMIENVINQVHPDYIQIDCKGHPGLSSYPTKVGNQAPGIVGDPLRLWRQVTAEHGVALYMHYSGVWDSEAIRQHPDWAVINADGSTNKNATSFFGPYAERLLIPQLRELAGDYGVDGAWVDGECWASAPDFGEPALKAFRAAARVSEVPRKPGDPNWYEFLQFNRDAFRSYLRHYIEEVKRTNPEMQLCSNWAFTDHMPEAVSADVDWISGDFPPEDSVNSARFSGRYMSRQGKLWDLMAWSFTTRPGAGGSNHKSAPQLEREASVVLALGGGFQAYFTQKRDGSIREEELPVMAEVAAFCRARQGICHHAQLVPQVALLYSTAAHYRTINGLFNRDLSHISGTLQALLESQLCVEVLSEHYLSRHLAAYPLVVVPECNYLEDAFKHELIEYVRRGGNLLLIGPGTAALFAEQLGEKPEGPPGLETRFLEYDGSVAATEGYAQPAHVESPAQVFGHLHATNDTNSPAQPAASFVSLGRGKIAATYFSFSQAYLNQHSVVARSFLNDLSRRLFPLPMVEVKGSSDVDVVLTRIGGRLAVNLVNTAGPHADPKSPVLDSIPPVGPLEITIRRTNKPHRIVLEPGRVALPFVFLNGEARVTLPKLEIHSAVVVE